MALSPYWQNQTAGFSRGANNITTALMNRPMMMQRQALTQAEIARNNASAGEIGARTSLLNTQNDRAKAQLSEALQLAAELQRTGAVTNDADGNTIISKEAAPLLLSHAAGMGTGANDSANAVGNLMKALNSVPQAALARKATADRAALALKAATDRGFNLAPGTAHYDKDGKIVAQNPAAAGSGNAFDTISEKFPAVPGTPADVTPASTGFMGYGASPAVTNAPAVPYQPERTVTRKVMRGNVASGLASAAQTNAPPASVTNAPPAVAATNAPSGQPLIGEVPIFANEDAARAAGHGTNSVVRLSGVGTVRLH